MLAQESTEAETEVLEEHDSAEEEQKEDEASEVVEEPEIADVVEEPETAEESEAVGKVIQVQRKLLAQWRSKKVQKQPGRLLILGKQQNLT